MYIDFVELGNFRKLLATRIDLSPKKTIFVGANNSGKTSAMLAFRRFLSQSASSFKLQDLTLSHISALEEIGKKWEQHDPKSGDPVPIHMSEWVSLLPFLDLWLNVDEGEFHYVSSIMPNLDWAGGLIGLRLRLEPANLEEMFYDFRKSRNEAKALLLAASERAKSKAEEAGTVYTEPRIPVWPCDLPDYLDRVLSRKFKVVAYPLDPAKIEPPTSTLAKPQTLSEASRPLKEDPLKHLIRVNFEPAQRGMSDENETSGPDDRFEAFPGQKLSSQLGHYHQKHLDPTESPSPDDLGALEAIEAARAAFDERIGEAFQPAFVEVEGMNYPGITDPQIQVTSELKAGDILHHKTSVSYFMGDPAKLGTSHKLMRLPENQNGLGYQNLISMVFKLMRFRDAWMRVGKAEKDDETIFEPIHLVLLEEPEAHLHVQVQQVFIKKAYDVLRQHERLGDKKSLITQLVVSTHSSHVAHETPYNCLRYFRRLPAGMCTEVPISTVVNLKEVFGDSEIETKNFVTRYLRAQHSDLFFADAAILIEGSAERMLVPHFIENKFPFLHQCFVTLLEINGSHAHRLKELIEKLGLLTLIITDIDAGKKSTGEKAKVSGALPAKGDGLVTTNATLKSWLPKESEFDVLVEMAFDKKFVEHDQLFAVRVAYQTAVIKAVDDLKGEAVTIYPSTFEDSMVLQNVDFFKELEGNDLTRKIRETLTSEPNWSAVATKLYEALGKGSKASFALDVLSDDSFDDLTVPNYIAEGLKWLEDRLRTNKSDILPKESEDG
ncbi:Predicted ATP-dependent endonuclease of the OLD family, contains P-loop ATPase and TOPRIM domains [Thalassococcus halodurans]|uniref:Predicted ATP-dependent endonuclease of the OLD family, contains P-loop ATPase and TOPRIM domains n=1 Tax=Thalassococcus halodurans TaxID=373675 RepID=A0A1H5X7V7_9RHOB|nr:AAA family ATPase [Thalassococcus halodurans]SEG07490.1 Predicted ATP-dependent endonuclease of the OLD family, contains P-loop ATPase and TOPRIM domains [Thalassococcus halodurans]